jgi:fumarylacetoacetate (FAA) hydrolase family protein
VLLDQTGVYEISDITPTISQLPEIPDIIRSPRRGPRKDRVCSIEELIRHSHSAEQAEPALLSRLLAPCNLQVVKACGVTFARSTLERVAEERTRGTQSRPCLTTALLCAPNLVAAFARDDRQ